MKEYVIISYCAVMLLVSSCHSLSESSQKMLQAEQCINSYPDSALTLLDSLQPFIWKESKEVQMYYFLLAIKARYKCYLPCTSDSLISVVVDYYQKSNDRDKLMEAYYLKGCILQELQDIPRALKEYQQAIQLSEGSKQYRTLALIYSQIGYVYLYQDMNTEAISMLRRSYYYSKKAKNFAKLGYPMRDIARAYSELGKKDSAIYYYRQAYVLAQKDNRAEADAILNELGGYYVYVDEYKLAHDALRASNAAKENNQYVYYLRWGLFYQRMNRMDSAKYYFQKSIPIKGSIHTTAEAYLHLAELEEAMGNSKEAFRLLRIHQQWQDSIKIITNTEIAQRMHSLYNYKRTETENLKLKEENTQREIWIYRLIFLAIVVFLAGAGCILYEKQKKRQLIESEKRIHEMKEKQYQKSLEHIVSNDKLIGRLQSELNQTAREKQQLIEAQVKSLEAVNYQIRSQQQERELKIKVLRQSAIYSLFHTEGLAETDLRGNEWVELQQAINDTYDNFAGQLYVLYPKLSFIELRICCLLKISVKVTAISQLLGRTKSSISTARGKLYEKLQGKKGTPEMLDELLSEL